jgi:formylglycine-generating enzyme required for sulfatase activity
VTNDQYLPYVRAAGRQGPDHWERGEPPLGKGDHPVVYVSWHDAVAYCEWLSRVTGRPYQLPSEAQWEKAARGTDGRRYPWGNEYSKKKCNARTSGYGGTTPVGTFSPHGDSPFGCADMAGNVAEWCRNLVWPYPYKEDKREDMSRQGPRVFRGGSFSHSERSLQSWFRHVLEPDGRYKNIGFRVAFAALPLSHYAKSLKR